MSECETCEFADPGGKCEIPAFFTRLPRCKTPRGDERFNEIKQELGKSRLMGWIIEHGGGEFDGTMLNSLFRQCGAHNFISVSLAMSQILEEAVGKHVGGEEDHA